MEAKHTAGTSAAAWEISDLIDIAFVTQHRNKRHDTIEAIIESYRTPAEKAAPTLQARIDRLEAEKAELKSAAQELLVAIKEDWGISERYKAIRRLEAALAKYEEKE